MMRRAALVASVGVMLLVGACSPGDPGVPEPEEVGASEGGTTRDPIEMTPITVTMGGACICHAPLYVGIEKGFFADRGLEISYRQLTGGFTAMGSLQTGDADVADAAVAAAAAASGQGIEAQAVVVGNGDASGTVDTSEYFAIVAREGSGIIADDLDSLRGKTIGAAEGTIAHQYLYDTLRAAGIDSTSDLTVQSVQAPDLVSALQSGSVDAIVGWEPGPLQALASVEGSYIVVRGGGAMQYLFARWFAPDFLESNPDAARAFVEGFVEAMQYARANPDETADIVAKEFTSLDRAIIVEALGYLNFDPRVSQFTLEAAAQAVSFAQNSAGLATDFEFRDHLEFALLESVLADHPEWLADLPEIPASKRLE